MFDNYISIPAVFCPAYGDEVRVNPDHIISITLHPATDGYNSNSAYISIRLSGTMMGSSINTTFSSWEEWDNFTKAS
jgi:hypothetical protein